MDNSLEGLNALSLIDERLPLKLAQTLGASLTSKDEMFLVSAASTRYRQ
jgi:hypothetical protein